MNGGREKTLPAWTEEKGKRRKMGEENGMKGERRDQMVRSKGEVELKNSLGSDPLSDLKSSLSVGTSRRDDALPPK